MTVKQLQEEFAVKKKMVFFYTATFDHNYTWEEITPGGEGTRDFDADAYAELLDNVGVIESETVPHIWADGQRRFRISGCNHRVHADDHCVTCGEPE